MQISNPQIVQLRDILAETLRLTEMDDAVLKLGHSRPRITLADNLDAIFRDVIVYYNNRSRIQDLLAVSRAINPTNPELYLFDQGLGHAARLPDDVDGKAGVEALVRPHLPSFSAHEWFAGAAAAENCVCLIGDGDTAMGTGFLIGPDAVMTNYHVVRRFIEQKVGADPANLTFRFDFMMLAGVNKSGVVYRAAMPDWLIDASPLHPSDDPKNHPGTPLNPPSPPNVPADQLDYAVLRVAGRPGEQPVGGDMAPSGLSKPRGWLNSGGPAYDFADRKALILFHHAQGDPLQFSIDTDSYFDANPQGTRVFHRTSTERGSSGSPCFDLDWNLVALHQGSSLIAGQLTNRAAPMPVIRRLLDARGKLAAVAG